MKARLADIGFILLQFVFSSAIGALLVDLALKGMRR